MNITATDSSRTVGYGPSGDLLPVIAS
jgi:hypothetical protein